MTSLDIDDLHADPAIQVRAWLNAAIQADAPVPTAMTLATADLAGRPSARTVLLKGVDAAGIVFFTNYRSDKARELDANPYAALVLHWAVQQRQVRVTGPVTRTTEEESDAYFLTRPPGSRISAWASPQSTVIADRAVLERRATEMATRHPDGLPRPPHWGGYRVGLAHVEFWQGRPDRLHDRLRYTQTDDGSWHIERLAP